jgi:formylglycine-generating enzyme required for sulfatase activity
MRANAVSRNRRQKLGRAFAAAIGVVWPVLLFLSACTGKTPPAGLEVIITAPDLRQGVDFDAVEADVSQQESPGGCGGGHGGGWNPLFDVTQHVPVPISLPTTLVVQAGSSSDQEGLIVVTATKNGQFVVSQSAQLQIPTDREAELVITLSANCEGVMCPSGMTCKGHVCVSDLVDSRTLPDAGTPVGDGGADGGINADGEGGGEEADASPDGTMAPGAWDSGEDADASPDAGTTSGCGKPWTGVTGQWVSQPTGCAQGINNQGTAQCPTIPPGAAAPLTASLGTPERRGWWVLVPNNYDPKTRYPVIYEAAGEGDPNYFHAGADGYAYQNVDNDEAIQVGLDYDTFSTSAGDYDSRNPQSNDLAFVPWLMNEIESTLCVDTTREWISNYTSGGPALAQQLDCAMPGKFRGQVLVGGGEPGAGGLPGMLPICNPAPMAALYVHDTSDPNNPYASILAGCSRVLKQNGCTDTRCNPMDAALTTPYPAPAGVTLPPRTSCVEFNGCPAAYPVVFCTTQGQVNDGTTWGAPSLLWDFIKGLRGVLPADPPSCAPGGPGMTNCGPGGSGTESCCTSLEVAGGTFDRTYKSDADGGAIGLADQATVSGFRLDKYLVTVGRFRQFVRAVLPPDGGTGWLPLPGSGKHAYFNAGSGLVNAGDEAGAVYESGWLASDDGNIAPTDANLAIGPFSTWTNTPGSRENLPINTVNWWEAYAFCIFDGGFLPSEAEWEYAAAGGSEQREYPWGSTPPGTSNQYAIINCNYPIGSPNCPDIGSIAPVGYASMGAGLWGQLDLSGELFEWNLDSHVMSYDVPCTDCTDVTAAVSERVARGGSYDDGTYTAWDRSSYDPRTRDGSLGFRCARAP